MPPKSSKGESAPPSRRSERVSGAPKSNKEDEATSKKRTAEEKPKSGPASKKAKPDTSTAAPKSGAGKKETNGDSKAATKSKTDVKSKDEKKEVAPVKSKEEEKKVEAKASEEPSGGKGLKKGDKLPKLTLKDEEDKDVKVGELAGEKGAVIFLYPKANTPGCTNQACGFRDAFDDISALGYEIYGLSMDKPNAQKNWKEKQKLNYKLLCDPDSTLIKKLGAFVQPKNTKRSHFIFEKGSGKLIDAAYGVKPADDPKNCLKFIKEHHK